MNWIQIVGPSLLMIIGGILTWFIKSRVEELRVTEEKLREDRRKIYNEILDPYIRLFSDMDGESGARALNKIASYEYKKTSFELSLFGSDNVVGAYNKLLSYMYQIEDNQSPDSIKLLHLWGGLLLEIRKSLGNKKTKLTEVDMLRGMIKDLHKYNL